MIWEHVGDNRSGKTLLNAILAWEAYRQGRTVYCNCPRFDEDSYECILNFPHQHLDPYSYYGQQLVNCYLMTDESADDLSARQSMRYGREELTKFGRQVKKRGVDWHYDAVRHRDIDVRIRLNPDYILESFRVPRNIKEPLRAIKVKSNYRYATSSRTFWVLRPWEFFPVYNHIPHSMMEAAA